MDNTKTPKCTCGRPAATHAENPEAAQAGKCAVCYQISLYLAACGKSKAC